VALFALKYLWCCIVYLQTVCMFPAEVLQCFLATREAMQLQQNETVYESSGTSTLPSSTESPGTPDRDPPQRPWDHHSTSDQGLSFPAACHLLVSRCLFLLLGVRAAWQEEIATPTESSLARSAFVYNYRTFACTCWWDTVHLLSVSDKYLSLHRSPPYYEAFGTKMELQSSSERRFSEREVFLHPMFPLSLILMN